VRRLRQQLGYGGLVLGVTGHQSVSVHQEFMAAGADKVLTKPLKFDALFTMIQDYERNRGGAISAAPTAKKLSLSSSEIP
jgi:DNA-binding response OmpR family regulator